MPFSIFYEFPRHMLEHNEDLNKTLSRAFYNTLCEELTGQFVFHL
jgi:hypothetical protein